MPTTCGEDRSAAAGGALEFDEAGGEEGAQRAPEQVELVHEWSDVECGSLRRCNARATADRAVHSRVARTAAVRDRVRLVRCTPAARAGRRLRVVHAPRLRAAATGCAAVSSRLARNSLDRCPRGAKQFASSSGSLGFRSCAFASHDAWSESNPVLPSPRFEETAMLHGGIKAREVAMSFGRPLTPFIQPTTEPPCRRAPKLSLPHHRTSRGKR